MFCEEVVEPDTVGDLVVHQRPDRVRFEPLREPLVHDPLDSHQLVVVHVAVDPSHQDHGAAQQSRETGLIHHSL